MPRYTDIELTSRNPDGSWTWRAAGARQPRGSVARELIPSGAKVSDVMRAEVESGLEGIEIVSVSMAKPVRREEDGIQRIEVLGAPRGDAGVVVTMASGSSRLAGGDQRPRRDRPARDRGGPDRRRGRRDAAERPSEGRRPPRSEDSDAGRRGRGPDRRAQTSRRPQDSESAPERRAAARRDRRPTVAATYRNAALAELRPEQLPIAEQLLRGGIPAVRQAIDEQNAAAKAQGQPPVAPEPFLAMAEELLPIVNLATWKDRATAAQNVGRSMRLRELRAVVAASRTVTLDEEGRNLAKALQQSLTERVDALRDEWRQRIDGAIDAGKVLEALQVSARPPEPATRCPAELAVRLARAASEAMTGDLTPEAWIGLLNAVLESPVRRTVKPTGIPDAPQVTEAARRAAGLVPELAKFIGLPIPPPPSRRPTGTPTVSRASDVAPAVSS
jgi:hypothetical protein